MISIVNMLYTFSVNATTATTATTTATATTTTCEPLACKAYCTPSCSVNEACILRTMTDCAICPASTCLSRTVLGLPPITSNTTNANSNKSSSDTTGPLIGGIVGGLIGVGLLIGIGVYCYIKKNRSRGKLPFAFTAGASSSRNIVPNHHEKCQQTVSPHPAVIAALSHQLPCDPATSHSKPIGLTDISPVDTPLYTNNALYNNTFNISNTSNYNHQNNNVPTSSTKTTDNSSRSSYYPTPATQPTPSPPPQPTHGTIPEEFEERIALQNKRISEILYNNPRLSQLQHQRQQLQPTGNRNSSVSYTTTDDDDSEYDYNEDNTSSLPVSTTATSQTRTSQMATSIQAVQMTRAKPQIMRVNSVRSSVANSGLSRSGSTKTILTAMPSVSALPATTQPSTPEEEDDDGILNVDHFPSTPNNQSFADDPFHDVHSTVDTSDNATNGYWNNKK